MQNQKKNFKKKPNLNKKKFSNNKPRVKKSLQEDDEIEKLKNSYDLISCNDVKNFDSLPLSKKTLKGLRECKYRVPTEIQRQSILFSLQGKDVLGAAITGSGMFHIFFFIRSGNQIIHSFFFR